MFENFSTWLRHRREVNFFRSSHERALPNRQKLFGFSRYPCPCCGLPTIDEPGIYDICAVCWWEDDGRDGDSPFSPNRVPMSEARANFYRHFTMFPPGLEPDGIADTPEQKERKRELVALFDLVRSDTDSGSQDWIRSEINRMIAEIQRLR
jgi:hypothetical protein